MPNLLFLFTDEQRADTMAAYGNDRIDTPNLNRLAADSAVFERTYVTQPVCTPSRASILTGLYPHSCGCTANNVPLPAEVPCRKEIFCARDRRTALAMVGPYLEEKYRLYAQWGQDKAMPADERLDLPFEELTRQRFVIGSPEDCYEQLRPYWEELGVTQFVFRTHFIGMPISHALHSMRMISDELLPALRAVQPAPLR